MNVQREIDKLIAERASQWLETLRGGKTEEYLDFIQWIGESPRHLREFLAQLALQKALPGAFVQANIDRDALLKRVAANAHVPVITTPSAAPSALRPTPEVATKSSSMRRPTGLWALAAALLMAIGASLWIGLIQGGDAFTTVIGEQRTVTLQDGSLMWLNAHSRVRVDFKDHVRDIELLDGEALFQVARDPTRPFRVHTKDAIVQAVGTRFNVNTRPSRTVVSVLEGKVEVAPEAARYSRTREPLTAGEAAEVSREGKIERRAPGEANTAGAWLQRQLVFSKTPLEDAAADFNRFHKQGRLLLEDVTPGSHHYTGTFNADDVASFAAMLMREPDLTVERKGDDYVVRRMPSRPAP